MSNPPSSPQPGSTPDPAPWNNPLLNTQQPQREGYLTPGSTPAPVPAIPPVAMPAAGTPTPAGGAPVVKNHLVTNEDGPDEYLPLLGAADGDMTTVVVKGKGTPQRTAEKRGGAGGLAGVIDTLEAIIIALILALTFRAFVVEAFVIPTGSMAPTLLGAHFDVRCPKCGFAFKENADLNVQYAAKMKALVPMTNQRGELVNSTWIPAPETRVCPNCGYGIQASQLPGNPVVRGDDKQSGIRIGQQFTSNSQVFFPWANNGDRILVLKYLYALAEPQRWDVIVFKEPRTKSDNYIKRLVGLPGETLELAVGDLFIKPAGQPEAPMAIARKPQAVQEAEWQVVYDNDYFPMDAGQHREEPGSVDFQSPWRGQGTSAGSWNTGGALLEYKDKGPGSLAFVPGPMGWYLYNVRGYNNDLIEGTNPTEASQSPAHVPVTDVRLEAAWRSMSPDRAGAKLALVAGPASYQFRVVWDEKGIKLERWSMEAKVFQEITGGGVKVTHEGGPELGRWYHVALNNVDHQVQFYIDGKLVLEYQTPWTIEDAEQFAARQLAASQETKPELAQLGIEVGGAAQLNHVRVLRDVFYTDYNSGPRNPLNPLNRSKRPLRQGVMGIPVTLQADEFFAMGDNSTASFDSRGWEKIDDSLLDLPVGKEGHFGIVPRRFLLGRAFFVYWPAGFRPMNGASWDQFKILDIPLVPNVGEMRFIH